MKQAISCIGCGDIVRLNETYKVNVREIIKSPLTGEIKENEIVWRICRDCAKRAGYKVKKGKKDEV
jgi:hypothetical protein